MGWWLGSWEEGEEEVGREWVIGEVGKWEGGEKGNGPCNLR